MFRRNVKKKYLLTSHNTWIILDLGAYIVAITLYYTTVLAVGKRQRHLQSNTSNRIKHNGNIEKVVKIMLLYGSVELNVA